MKKFNYIMGCAALLMLATSCGGQSSSETSNKESSQTPSTTTSQAPSFDLSKNIKLYTRKTDSGTRDGFFTGIGLSSAKEDNTPLATGFVQVDSNGDMISALKNDKFGLGYISLASLKDSTLKGLSYENAMPNEANVLNGTYKLTRNFNYIIRDSFSSDDKKDIVNAFIAYINTQEGKATMKAESGILSITAEDSSWNSIKNNYPVTKKDNSAITINLGGSTSVSKMATKLANEFKPLCGNVNFSFDYKGSGDAYKKTQGSEKDSASNFDMAFASREFNLTSSEPAVSNTYGKLCIDAIVAAVNSVNSKDAVNAKTLADAYTGKISTWNQF